MPLTNGIKGDGKKRRALCRALSTKIKMKAFINTLFRINVFSIITFYSAVCFAGGYLEKPQYNSLSSDRYKLEFVNEKTILITDLMNNKKFQKQFSFSIYKYELCDKYPYFSFIPKKEFYPPLDHFAYIYNIETDKLYHAKLYPGSQVKRWSNDSEYTYISHYMSFAIVKTEKLDEYLKSNASVEAEAIIIGHMLGSITQITWMDDNKLIYATGCCELTVYGVLDIERNKNYFVERCVLDDNKICKEIRQEGNTFLKNYIAKKMGRNELIEVSYNFMDDVIELIEQGKIQIESNKIMANEKQKLP